MSSTTTVSTLSASPATNVVGFGAGTGPIVSPSVLGMAMGNTNNSLRTIATTTSPTRRFSSPTLYEVRRRHSGEVCYLFVPDELELIKSHVMKAAREELSFLQNTITMLANRLKLLELENSIFRRYAPRETLEYVENEVKTNYKPRKFHLELPNGTALSLTYHDTTEAVPEAGLSPVIDTASAASCKNDSGGGDGPLAAAVVATKQNAEASSTESETNSM